MPGRACSEAVTAVLSLTLTYPHAFVQKALKSPIYPSSWRQQVGACAVLTPRVGGMGGLLTPGYSLPLYRQVIQPGRAAPGFL